MKTLNELLHLTYNEDGIYILSWKRPDFQVENEYQSAEISKDDFEKISNLLTNSSTLEGEQSEHLSPNKENEIEEIPLFNGTMDKLNKLSVIKENKNNER